MNVLTVFEQRIGAIFEGNIPGEQQPFSFKRLAKRAVREMEDETFVIDGVDTAPALYTILVSEHDDEIMRPIYVTVTNEISQLVEAQAKKRGYTFVGRPLVRFMVDPSLRPGRFSVFAENIDPRTLARLRDEERAYLGITPPREIMPDEGFVPESVPVREVEPAPVAQEVAYIPDDYVEDEEPDVIVEGEYEYVEYAGDDSEFPAEQDVAFEEQVVEEEPLIEAEPEVVVESEPVLEPEVVPELEPEPASAVNPAIAAAVASIASIDGQGKPEPVAAPEPELVAMPEPEPELDVDSDAGLFTIPNSDVQPEPEPAPEPAPAPAPVFAPEPTYSCTLTDLETGRTYQITSKRAIIGRERTPGGVVLHDPNVSRRHAELFFDRGFWRIRDLHSTNGTLVNDMDVPEAILSDRDVLIIGLTNLEFRA